MNGNDSGSNLGFWLPGSAIVLSLIVSTFALTRAPFLEQRPFGAQFQTQLPIEARLWQDPFDALERYRKRLKDNKSHLVGSECTPELFDKSTAPADQVQAQLSQLRLAAYSPTAGMADTATAQAPTAAPQAPGAEPTNIMVALVEGGPYAEEVELRRRMRYAMLAGFKTARMVPEDEQNIRCLTLTDNLLDAPIADQADAPTNDAKANRGRAELPYEIFVANPFDPPTDMDDNAHPSARTILFWLKQNHLGTTPLQKLEQLRLTLSCKVSNLDRTHSPTSCTQFDDNILKVIGPADSTVLRDMYRQEYGKIEVPNIEIYSPLATADRKMLLRGIEKPKDHSDSAQAKTEYPKQTLKLLRTISDDRTMTTLLLDELKLRRIDPVTGLKCAPGAVMRVGNDCSRKGFQRLNRIALISEWDSFYSRALIESFKTQVAESANLGDKDKAAVDEWVLRFSYLRGLDGRLPEEAANADKAGGKDGKKDSFELDTSPLEKSDGNSQLDYLRRLAEHIAHEDELYRRKGENGIGAIGILGLDTYDKLLALQALKSRMPHKVFFSTDLDARMLQRGQAETTRNLVLAAPYGLTLTRALQQDVPPFRDSLQSAVFIAVLAAQSPQSFDAKRAKFDYNKSGLLSPGIYEVGIKGFIPLASRLSGSRPEDCAAPDSGRSDRISRVRPQDIMALRCLQDRAELPYPEVSTAMREGFTARLSFFKAGPLSLILLVLALSLGWWWTYRGPVTSAQLPSPDQKPVEQLFRWVYRMPMSLYAASTLSALVGILYWRVEFMWIAFVLILLGIVCAELIRRTPSAPSRRGAASLFDASGWYILVPMVVFILALLWAYQIRHDLTNNGLGEPMFLFQGISAWPTAALRLLAALISISALLWGWRNLQINRNEIREKYHLSPFPPIYWARLWRHFPLFNQRTKKWSWRHWLNQAGHWLFKVTFPLSPSDIPHISDKSRQALQLPASGEQRSLIFISRFWREHCECGTFTARLLRAALATWFFLVVTSGLMVVWPMEGIPVRGTSTMLRWSWLLPFVFFQLLVFWVVDANRLLTRFIRQLSDHHGIWPAPLRSKHEEIFGTAGHPCFDDWMDMTLIAERTAAVNRLIYAPTVVLLIMIASRSSYFDNWPTPPSIAISFLLTAVILLSSAISLRRAAEKARRIALQRIDDYLLRPAEDNLNQDKLEMIRARIAALSIGAFSRYSEEPLVRALLLSLTGIGGSIIVDAINFSKF
ncbi:hypothetical protein [Pseudomonas sp. BBP2017]|uniref:hypothetical protein n=1 Tax=Pseudomonas sp. BBP2017 TaxID=2109731 RepID=UPI000D11A4BB|nr:hypothetical protein [Pseudomonas sp. BBP2017]PSS58817.1 hypothetical protein C6382_00015 [Pseudomonas sp. BBP2017]